MPDFPHNTRIRMAKLKIFFVASSLADSQQGRDRATSERNKFFLIGPILFLYYEESLVSSNLNSDLLRFHCAHPNVGIPCKTLIAEFLITFDSNLHQGAVM